VSLNSRSTSVWGSTAGSSGSGSGSGSTATGSGSGWGAGLGVGGGVSAGSGLDPQAPNNKTIVINAERTIVFFMSYFYTFFIKTQYAQKSGILP
jgi:hypothetical protein